MSKVHDEGNLRFDFTAYDTVERFDVKNTNPNGMKAVDFIAETNDCLYFIEVKDFQHPSPKAKQNRQKDFDMLIAAGTEKKAVFNLEMGEKIKDSLLRKYAEGYTFEKSVKYLLFINLDILNASRRRLLYNKINGHVPTALNDKRFHAFKKISFDLVNAEQLRNLYGIACTDKSAIT